MAASEDRSATRPYAPRHSSEPPGTIVLVIGGSIGRAEIPELCEGVRLLLGDADADQVVCDVRGLVDPDAAAVDALARLQLTARRLGCRVRLLHPCGELQDLLALMGLGDVLPCLELPLEPRGEAEEREHPGGVEEEADPGDLTV